MLPLRSLLPVLGLALLAAPARATWSIVVVNTRTGEAAVASATCIDGFDLQKVLPVVVPGLGAAAAQSVIDSSGNNRRRIWDELQQGADPQAILARLAAHDTQHQKRQYGIVDFGHFPLSFTGTQCSDAKYSIAGVSDDLRYAIQGNILVGVLPLYAAEDALLSTQGDLSQKLIAAMEAARAAGGDGRCSCNEFAPTSCGAPPPSFTYSSYTCFLVVSRMGDAPGGCDTLNGCAAGDYYLDINVVSGPGGPEPVLFLESHYAGWRNAMHGVADAIRSVVRPSAQSLPADGATRATVDVELRDLEGGAVTLPSDLTLELDPASPDLALGPVEAQGGARYRFALGAGLATGTARVRMIAHHGTRRVRLWPDLVLTLEPAQGFACGYEALPAAQGALVPLVANLGAAHAGAPYLMLASASGTQPGTPFGGTQVPLNADALFWSSVTGANGPRWVNTAGVLGPNGRAQGTWVVPPLALSAAVGQRIDFAALKLASASGPAFATNTDGLLVVP